MSAIRLQGETVHTNGEPPAPGERAPDAAAVDQDLNDVRVSDFLGQRLIVSFVPSLETPTCELSTRKLDRLIGAVARARLLVVSCDLPFAQGHFLLREELQHVAMLSMMRDRELASAFGVLLETGALAGLCARALVVIDAEGLVLHSELVPDLSQEPDYDAAMAALAG